MFPTRVAFALAVAACGLALYASSANAQKLNAIYAKAKQEGALTIYAGGPAAPWEAFAKDFSAKYPGIKVSVTGGFSNVSFGMPCRKLINEVFLNLAVEAGADSAIIDPVTTNLNKVFLADRQSPSYQLAEQMLLGHDPGCVEYLRAWREGELETAAA